LLCAMLLCACSLNATTAPSLQAMIDAAEPNALLTPPPGRYRGPLRIDHPLVLDGRGQVQIDAGGKGSVIYLHTDGATLKGLHLTNSGDAHNDIDAGVQVRGNFNVIKDNRIDNSLFGIDLQQSANNIVKNNRITSKDHELGMRGDAIRLWYSLDNQITDNQIRDSRDMVVWYSAGNLIARNHASGGRYSLHFMYSKHNEVVDNRFENNAVGIFLMYSDGVILRNNRIANATGATGMGIGFKETSDVELAHNQILYCGVGLYLDVSPYQPDSHNNIHDNLIAYSGIGIQFLNDWSGNILEGNRFKGNLTQVAVSGGGKTANRNQWLGNYWDDYQGFDADGDGIGDTPYELFSYADRIWMDIPAAQFFKGSPLLEVLDFLERLAPFNPPNMLVRDRRPLMHPRPMVANNSPRPDMPPHNAPAAPPAYDALKALQDSLGR
jgi:nitrous oxidase accessory protein